uniref:Uncharacterized protein n=1 Tax=Anopheles melas TaxID=34690 RepID=A0A182TP25_9DIPT
MDVGNTISTWTGEGEGWEQKLGDTCCSNRSWKLITDTAGCETKPEKCQKSFPNECLPAHIPDHTEGSSGSSIQPVPQRTECRMSQRQNTDSQQQEPVQSMRI